MADEITGIEIGDKLIKAFKGKRMKDTLKVSNLIIQNSPSLSEALDKIPKVLKKLQPQNLVLFLPCSKFSTKYLKLPTGDPSEVREMVKFKAKKQFLYAQKEVMFSYNIIAKTPQGQYKVMLVVSRKDIVDKYLSPFQNFGIKPDVVTINSLGVKNWYNLKFPRNKKNLCLVDLDWTHTNVCILNKDKFVYSREIKRGVESIRGSNKGLDEIIMQLRRTVSAYDKENIGPKIEAIVITGAVEEIEQLCLKLKQNSDLEIDYISPIEKVKFNESISEVMIQVTNRMSLAKVLGALKPLGKFEINFFEEEKEEKKRKLSFYKKSIFYGLVFTLLSVSIIGTIGWEYYRKLSYVTQLKKVNNEIEARIKKLKKREGVIEKVLSHLKREGTILNVVKEIGKGLPQGVMLKQFNYRYDRKKVSINGVAEKSGSVTQFIRNLRKSSLFNTVSQKYVRDSQGGGKIFAVELKFLK